MGEHLPGDSSAQPQVPSPLLDELASYPSCISHLGTLFPSLFFCLSHTNLPVQDTPSASRCCLHAGPQEAVSLTSLISLPLYPLHRGQGPPGREPEHPLTEPSPVLAGWPPAAAGPAQPPFPCASGLPIMPLLPTGNRSE